MLELISASIREDEGALASQFAQAKPFRHIVIDDFLETSFAANLLGEFPAFERGNYIGEDGNAGSKSTHERMATIGPSYARLDEMIRSPEFLTLLGRVTGIPGLIHDPWYLGGGTHENRHGAALSPHIDFNFHPLERWHRRLNLIVYLNRDWASEWGGQLDLYENPRRHGTPDRSIIPAFNRCVIFETTDSSWHGFGDITLPEAACGCSRKSIALYFYTNPADAHDPPDQAHSTVYVGQRLPPHLHTGHTLSGDDMAQLHALVANYDQRMTIQYDEIARLMTLVQAYERGPFGTLVYFARKIGQRLRQS